MGATKKVSKVPRNVFNVSGGLSSAYMAIHYGKPGDLFIFTDTGREHPATYEFLNKLEVALNSAIIRTSYLNSPDPFRALLSKSKYRGIPNMAKRSCTITLKIRTAKAYLKQNKILYFNNFIGFRADEQNRVLNYSAKIAKVTNHYPMIEHGINKQMVNHFWNQQPFTLEIPPILGNCTLCFMKGKNAIINILKVYPELAAPWIADEQASKLAWDKKNQTYIKGTTYQQLLDIASNNLFKDVDLSNITPAYSCKCST